MRDPLSSTIKTIQPSGIRKFFDIVSEMKDAISLGVGEPDFDTPWHIRDEGIYSLEKGRTFYTSNAGLKELKVEIARYLDRRYGMTYDYNKEIMAEAKALPRSTHEVREIRSDAIVHARALKNARKAMIKFYGTPDKIVEPSEEAFKAAEADAIVTIGGGSSMDTAKAIGIIILGWGVVQLGMSVQSHDATQRTQGVLCLFGGLLIAFAKEILTAIGVV